MRKFILFLLAALVISCGVRTSAVAPTDCPASVATKRPTTEKPSSLPAPAALSPSCYPVAAPFPIRLKWVPKLVDSELDRGVRTAAAEWNTVLGETVFSFEPGDGQEVDLGYLQTQAADVDAAGNPTKHIAETNLSTEPWTIQAYLGVAQIDMKSMYEHELGHALGLVHSTNFNDVMYGVNYQQDLTATDISRAKKAVADRKVAPYEVTDGLVLASPPVICN